MVLRHLTRLLVTGALATGLAAVPAQAKSETVALAAAAKKQPPKHRAARREQPQRQVACTVLGCHPVPAGCHPETGYYWNGLPTGFDVVVCR